MPKAKKTFHACSSPYPFSYVCAMKIYYKGDLGFFTHCVALTSGSLKWHLSTSSIPPMHVAFTSLLHCGKSLRQSKLAGTLQSLGSPAAPRHGACGAVGDDYAMGLWEHVLLLPLPSASSPLWYSHSWGEQTGFGAAAPSVSHTYAIPAAETAGSVAGARYVYTSSASS